jgi:hypothetical protein
MKRVVLTIALAVAIVVPAAATARPAATTIGVKASEFKFVLTKRDRANGNRHFQDHECRSSQA